MRKPETIRTLVVEDDYLIREMVIGYLNELKYAVVGQASNGRQAIEMVQKLRPDVIVMDLRMPDMDGIQAAQYISNHCPTPIVVLTAYETFELLKQTSDAGVGAYLVKPSNTQELERAITIARARFDDMLQLRRMNQELESRNADLAAYSHTVSHDIQNFLQLIYGFAEALDRYYETMDREDLTTCATSIMRNVEKMNVVTKELLLLAEVRKTRALTRPIQDMGELVENALGRLAHLVEEFHPVIEYPEKWPVAMGYGPWLEEVWLNYLSNAILYGGAPPRIELGASEQLKGQVRFWVRDHGPGIALEEQAQLFKPFDDATQVKLEGNGLGLSIVQRIVEKLEGTVGVESVMGEGSTFFFTLPAIGTPPKLL
ncbi:MAG TPA: response regulator [Anaerolineae bacterium]|nr:response regulator [Anaerolineae bacterium]